jgi:hypothetical protein
MALFCEHCGSSVAIGMDTRELNQPRVTKTFPRSLEHGRGLVPSPEWVEFLDPTSEELTGSLGLVCSSRFIRNNEFYQSTVSRLHFSFDATADELNAYACMDESIVYLRGLAVAQRVTAAVISVLDKNHSVTPLSSSAVDCLLTGVFDHIGKRNSWNTSDGVEVLQSLFASRAFAAGSILPNLSVARSIATACECYVIAHEIGHLALGHVQAGVVWPQNVQRNQEREADSFASSTLSQAPFAEYLFIGHLATLFLLLQSQRRRGEDHKSTHPDPESRLHSAYLNNPSLAAEAEKRLGISLELLSRVWRRMVS